MIEDQKFRIIGSRPPFKVWFPGISFGYGKKSNPILVAQTPNYMVLRKSGSQAWVGSSEYYPAEWFLIEVKVEKDWFRVKRVIEEKEPGRFWRRVRDRMILEMNEMERRRP